MATSGSAEKGKASDFVIRNSRPDDVGVILKLIKGLCEYENESLKEVENTEQGLSPSLDALELCIISLEDPTKDRLVEDGFGDESYFKCLVAEVGCNNELHPDGNEESLPGTNVVAFALYYFGYSTWKGRLLYLEDLYVMPEYRGKGIGMNLIKRLGQIAIDRKCCRMMWMCLDWNTPAKKFYDSIGADCLEKWQLYHFTNTSIQKFLDGKDILDDKKS